jgi:methionyl-tRNA synthetase
MAKTSKRKSARKSKGKAKGKAKAGRAKATNAPKRKRGVAAKKAAPKRAGKKAAGKKVAPAKAAPRTAEPKGVQPKTAKPKAAKSKTVPKPAPRPAAPTGARRYYLTTAIAYPNGVPHIGHAYEAIATDAIARFMRLDGYDVFFLTGTDEHGIKMLQTAAKEGVEPRALADRNVALFRKMVERLNCSNDDYIR